MEMGYLWLSGWGIYGLLGWEFISLNKAFISLNGGAFMTEWVGHLSLNGWGIMVYWVGHLWSKWVGQL